MRTTVRLLSSAVLAVAAIGLGAPGAQAAPGAHTAVAPGQFRDVPDPYSNKNETDSGTRHSEGEGEGSGREGQGESQGQGQQHYQQPSGHVRTGVGGSVGPDTGQVAAGVAVLAAAAAGGTLLLRRRASGPQSG
ncbi:hypothetical protein [Streptomyces yaizuensis]|uniref:LPXTG cell wall anchor domain-containing protein n=1 Tax=Streptomyces yaizuensis TaxID=2989713 RepID=A0ABQ5NU85_9ACTN|nr:hypothetical protein [Streptomyces sp. YSPA8]GLF93817.1 hypothetical protein SYYSPA8_05990 [Streptomyces sp. YSPA8]